MRKQSSFVNKFYSPSPPSRKKTATLTRLESSAIRSSFPGFRAPFQASPLETKKYNNTKCSLCQELLSLTLPGELIVLLECGHTCHKNCLSLIQSEGQPVPVCTECNVGELPKSLIDDFAEKVNYDYPPFTPVEQIQSSVRLNTQLETPSFSCTLNNDLDIYNPRVTCTSEISEVTLTPPYEIAYVLNVQAPLIFSNYEPTLEDLQLKERVEEFLKTRLDIDKDVGQLVIFDTLEISVTGQSWDVALVCLFENYLLIYEDELLVGIISVQLDISSIDGEDELVLNLAKDSLPELRLRHLNRLVIKKWGAVLLKMTEEDGVVTTNIYQLTNTYWTHIPREYYVPQDLIKLNKAILSGTTISNSDTARILPTPKQLLLNLILALPLVNQSPLTDLEYKTQLQLIFEETLHALRPNDKLGIIFLGIDGSKKPCAKGSFVGCTEPSWSEWKQVIRDITIVPNSFQSNLHEINVAIEKCMELYPFIPGTSSSVNKLLILSPNMYSDLSKNVPTSKFIDAINEKLSCTVVCVGKNYGNYQPFKSITTFDTPFLRFESLTEFGNLLMYLINENLHRICIPKLTLTLKAAPGFRFTHLDSRGAIDTSQLTLTIKDIIPQSQKLIVLKVQADPQFVHSQYLTVPIFEYDGYWFHEKCLDTKLISTRVKIGVNQQPPTPIDPEAIETRGSFTEYYLDIPLLPPVSPARDAVFAKRQTELAIINSLKKSIALGESQVALDIIKSCISLAHGLIRTSLGGSSKPQRNESNVEHEYSMLQLLMVVKYTHKGNDEYIDFLVTQMKSIAELLESDLEVGKLRCSDLLNSLI